MSSNPFLYIIGGVAIIGALFVFGGSGQQSAGTSESVAKTDSNVEIVGGTQFVTISVDGGYNPGSSLAKAGIPTVLRFVTSGSFDCSSSILIPSLKISQDLPATGTTDIDVGTLAAGTLSGTCSMGMYRFSVEAKS